MRYLARKPVRAGALGLACFCIGVLATVLWGLYMSYSIKNCIKKYPLTDQTLSCDEYLNASDTLKSLDATLDSSIAQYVSEGKVTRASIWVRDLNSKQWASTNENDTYTPASLLKVPLMIAYFKVAEIEPSILQTQLVFERSPTLNSSNQDYEPQSTLVPGQSYAVEDLIEHMIIYSDNDATALLLNHMDPTIFDNTLVDLGIKIPAENNPIDFVTAKTYANIFRTLYNASYLNRNDSEKALELMSQTKFTGLSASLPQGTVVSHKFGEREEDSPDGSVQTRELHDCGIVYKKGRVYTICIMTEGKNWDDMLSVIKDLSLITYQAL